MKAIKSRSSKTKKGIKAEGTKAKEQLLIRKMSKHKKAKKPYS
jgi:hypothetical protein